MKKLIVIVITFIFLFEGTGYGLDSLRKPLDFNAGGVKSRYSEAGEELDLPEQPRPIIKLMSGGDIGVLKPGYEVILIGPEGERYFKITTPSAFSQGEHLNLRCAREVIGGEARDEKEFYLTLNMNAWQYEIVRKLIDEGSLFDIWKGQLLEDKKGHPYFVSPKMNGKNLRVFIDAQILAFREGRINIDQLIGSILPGLSKIAHELDQLHQMGIVYGDIHPENIYVAEDDSFLLLPDFGRSSFNKRQGGALQGHRQTDIRGLGEIIFDVLEKTG